MWLNLLVCAFILAGSNFITSNIVYATHIAREKGFTLRGTGLEAASLASVYESRNTSVVTAPPE